MTDNKRVIRVIFSAVDDINQHLPKERQLKKSVDTILFDKSGNLDSLGLVNLIVALEERIKEEFGIITNLADEKTMSPESSPFKSIRTLADYVSLLLEENANG